MAAPPSDLRASALFDMTDRVALVTGGGTGIGLMIAQGLAANGAKVYIGGRRKAVVEKSAQEFRGRGKLIPLLLDVTDKSSIIAAKDLIASTDSYLDVLVNNAGHSGPFSTWMSDDDDPRNHAAEAFGVGLFAEPQDEWMAHFKLNAYSSFFMTSAFVGLLEKGSERHGAWTASAITITSMCGSSKLAQSHYAYNAGKAAATHIARMFATELARRSIPVRVNSLAPGVFMSELTQSRLEKGLDSMIMKQLGLHPIPAGRIGSDVEMVGTALWMVSAAGCYLNGQEILIDGGHATLNPSRL
ncbi:NAD(P)-binding protein [Schizophyllum commune H4-8]|uniref:NAD(P)-binding protein n=1 Tax=Schizophyllum commune (strain H4-8 / FGSC 9210) TaxID=578458 RepID=UPI00215E2AC6|nr:NAD(P)-binding protein [Schizophyllum commune H4-8]KAI5887559.1 NAD(P)-binding protein [Schizophyllum commune H4-8]